MPKSIRQKEKLLFVAKYFLEKTDENHTVTSSQLISYLEANGISAERKSLYDDITTLQDFGLDIVRGPRKRDGYFLASRQFELPEVKLLVDLVLASKFITEKKSRELIGKLETLVSQNEGKLLQRQTVVANRNKANNEHIYYSVDMLHQAIAENKQVTFQYFSWNEKKEMVLRKNGDFYQVSPFLLTWEDENYYLVAYDQKSQSMRYYRVDKMLALSLSQEERQGRESFEKMDVAAMSRRTFGMFAGQEVMVRFHCKRELVNVIIDRFGTEVGILPLDEEWVSVRTKVEVSPQFFGWLAGLGNRILIEGPEKVKDDYLQYLDEISRAYQD